VKRCGKYRRKESWIMKKIWKIRKKSWLNSVSHIFSLFNLLFFHIFRIFSHFNLLFFHIFHIISLK
jgi:hypothetical protein